MTPSASSNLSGTLALPLVQRASSASQSKGFNTLTGGISGRALEQHETSLRAFLHRRLRSEDITTAAWAQLRALATLRATASLARAPGVRAHLFSIAREVAASRKGSKKPLHYHHGGEFFSPLREGLNPDETELLELRYVCDLTESEMVEVRSEAPELLEQRLNAAMDRARSLLADRRASHLAILDVERRCQGEDEKPHHGRDPKLARLIIDAFRLEVPVPRQPAAELDLTLSSGARIGRRYQIQACVGHGSFGDVYRAEDSEVPGHVVALKILHQPSGTEQARQHALRELRHIASVFHPNVVQFKDHGWHDGRLWFVMPWYDGETLASRLEREPLSRDEARRIFRLLARALDAMHAAGIRHQDIKPDNIFLANLAGEGNVHPVLIDLGVSATEAELLVAGTPTYFAPEVAAQFTERDPERALPPVTSKADVFALCLTLKNSLEPWGEEDVDINAINAFIEERSGRSPSAPEGHSLRFLRVSFSRWLSRDATDRPTASELVDELDVLVLPETRRLRRRRLFRWMVPVLVVASALFGGAVVHYENAQHSAEEAHEREMTAASHDLQQSSDAREAIADRYARSELSRVELAEHLGEEEDVANQQRRQIAGIETRLAAGSLTLQQLRQTLSETREEHAESRQAWELQRETAEQNMTHTALRLSAVTTAAAEAQAAHLDARNTFARRLADLERVVVRLETDQTTQRAAVLAEQARTRELSAALEVQIAARRHAEDQVVRLRAISTPQPDAVPETPAGEPDDVQP